jgi:ribosomal protein S18 acetylase RimI-like enzyme
MGTLRPVAGYTWRPLAREDMAALYQMKLAADAVDGQLGVPPLEDVCAQYDDPWSDPAVDSLAAVAPDGQIAAVARVYVSPLPGPDAEVRAYLEGTVHPAHRERGLGTFILEWMQAHGRARLARVPGDRQRALRCGCVEGDAGRMALYERHGFRAAGLRRRYYADNGEDALIMWRTPATLAGTLDDVPAAGGWAGTGPTHPVHP